MGEEHAIKFTEGRWRPDEIALLMCVTNDCEDKDLKIICDICTSVGLKRPRRAIDKQLKRMLKYDKWVTRDQKQVLKQIEEFRKIGKLAALRRDQHLLVEPCKKEVL